MNKALLLALIIGTLSITTAFAETPATISTITANNTITTSTKNVIQATENYGIQSVTAVPKIYGDGEKVVAIIIKYPEAIQESSLALNTFTVEGKKINNIYTNSVPTLKENYVSTAKGLHNGATQVDTTITKTDTTKATKKEKATTKHTAVDQYVIAEFEYENSTPFVLTPRPNKQNNDGPKDSDAPMRSDRQAPNLNVTVTQVQPVVTKSGKIYKKISSIFLHR